MTVAESEKAALLKVNDVMDSVKIDGSDLLALPEGFFWWYLPTKEVALANASPFVAVVDSYIVGSELGINPCQNDTMNNTLMQSLSCMARNKSIYLAANLATKSTSCISEDDCEQSSLLWNTEVVFDRRGNIAATYRKSHVYGSTPPFDAPKERDDVSWFTAGGLRIGLLICFDLEFTEPSNKLVHEAKVDAVIMSQYWVNTPPVSWSTLYQQAWSLKNRGVTLVAVNDGNNAQTWGNGAYHNGWLVSNEEAFAPSREGEGRSAYPHFTWVNLPASPQDQYLGEGLARLGFGDSMGGESRTKAKANAPFPCIVPSYGTGTCIEVGSEEASAVWHGQVNCEMQGLGLELRSNGGSEMVVMAALDVSLWDPGTETPLDLLLCSVFVCSPDSSSVDGRKSVVQCEAKYNSFAAKTVNLTMNAKLDCWQQYQVFPLAAGSDLYTLLPS